ncbi:metallophosphoesterase [Glycocaulis alkaliphilus]|uniref:Metallophosphoesterase n=1 Tax=Glycocaulis alkaliphilus TaxID=1434191 RepID=A0A3T0EBF6_9PROT|nr:ligase-associated DNA damage response endonuclease PdeM [Glycocaulis alkaliphilus]AZU04773.1 metallophosphoesterase [Glycocaulis alkaliphilus]GGB67758.1 metallophosphatase [Glycocaulis alkaliphilus]
MVQHINVNGVPVLADVSGVAFVESASALIVADLHFEKGSSFAAKGVMLPPYDTRATLARLADAMVRVQPRTVIALGDSFHDQTAEARMHGEDEAFLKDLVACVERWVWIAGNHDPAPSPRYGGELAGEMELDGLTLRHEPREGASPGEVAGHLHPCAKVSHKGRSVRRRAFASDGSRLILPAFGAYTGGLNVRDDAFAAHFERTPDVWMLGRDRVYRVTGKSVLGD